MKRFLRTLAVGLLAACFPAVLLGFAATNLFAIKLILVSLIPIPPAVILYAWSDARNRGWRVRASAFILPLVPWAVWYIYLMFFIDSADAGVVADIGVFSLSCLADFAACSALALYGLASLEKRRMVPAEYAASITSNSDNISSDNPYQSPRS